MRFASMNPLDILTCVLDDSHFFLQGFAMSIDAWTSQRYYAARNEREGSMTACQWIAPYSLRFVLMAGMGILAVGIAEHIPDPEMALSKVPINLIPVGIKGVLISAIIAATLSMTDSLVSSSAYFVNDIYHPFIKPDASLKQLVRVSSLLTTAVLLVLGVSIGWFFGSISKIWGWITMGLLTGTLPPNILKWFRCRLNGVGYVCGAVGGVLAAIIVQMFFVDEPVYVIFTIVFAIFSVATIARNFLGKPTDEETLKEFYTRIRSLGYRKPIRKLVVLNLVREAEEENRRDVLLLPALFWQVSLFSVDGTGVQTILGCGNLCSCDGEISIT